MNQNGEQRAILHLDVDAFFASVEQRDDPHLRGKPVAVGTGVAASCSYEARRHGVCTGMRLAQARRLCRNLIVLPGAYPRYEQAARHVLAICADRTPLVEMAALDDLYLDVTAQAAGERGDGRLEPELLRWHGEVLSRLAAELRRTIQEEVRLSVSLGSGSNKLVAQLATNQAKPSRHIHVPLGQEREYLAPWPAPVLPGVGPVVADRLDRLNVQQVGEVAAMPVSLLQSLLGPRRGRVLHEQALGIDPRPVEPYKVPQSVGRRASFEPPVADHAFLQAMLGYLVERAAFWLRFQGLASRGLVLTIRYGDFQSTTGRARLPKPADGDLELKEAARDRFERLYQRRLPLRLLGVELSPLQVPQTQPTMFPDLQAERRRRLLEVQDEVRRRFGFTSLLSGSALSMAGRLPRDRENFHLRTPCLSR